MLDQPQAAERAFKITESELLPALRQQVRKRPDMRLTENGDGGHTLSWSGAPSRIAELILGALYASRPLSGEAWLAMPEARSMLLPGRARATPSSNRTFPYGTLRAHSLSNRALTSSQQQGAPGQPDYQALLKLLEDVCPLQPAVAARHSAKHDLVRVFSFDYALGGYPPTALSPASEYDGKVLLMVGNQTDPPPLCQSTPAGKPTLAVIPDDLSPLLAAAGEVAEASLAQPRNADITNRLTEARAALRSAAEEAFSPRNTRWVLLRGGTQTEEGGGEVRRIEDSGGEENGGKEKDGEGRRGTEKALEDSRDRWHGEQSTENTGKEAPEDSRQAFTQTRTANLELPARPRSETLSLAADIAYPSTPELPNEMINNWPALTSYGKRTRTNLLKAMVSESDQGDLGLGNSEGRYPAILAMYRSVLHRGGLHRYDARRDAMAFGKPTEASLRPAWNILSSAAASQPKRRVPLKELHVLLLSPPVGMRKATVAVFLTAWMLAAENRLRIFEGENEVSLDAESVLKMAEKPEQFAIEIKAGKPLRATT